MRPASVRVVSRRWRRGKLSIEYRGVYRQYTDAPVFNGLDQFLQIAYREASCAISLWISRARSGTTTLANGAFCLPAPASLDRLGLPTERAVR